MIALNLFQFHVIFDDTDGDGELEYEDEEYDSPIMEEDEDEDLTHELPPSDTAILDTETSPH